MLSAVNVRKVYDTGVKNEVIKGINLDINEGEYITITGKSGSGKSTLLYMLSGLEKTTEGQIVYNGNDMSTFDDKRMSLLRRTEFGFIFQFYNLIPILNVWDNICLPLRIHNTIKENDIVRIKEYIRLLGLDNTLDKYPYQLSGGQQQRVAITRALAINPKIIFADEPTGNLDKENGKYVLDILSEINKEYNKTIVLVTHDESINKIYHTRNIIVSDGKLL